MKQLLKGARIPDAVRLTANDHDCFNNCSMILSAIPTQYVRSVFTRLKSHIPSGVPIVSVAKGIENDTLLRPTEVILDVLKRSERGPLPLLAARSRVAVRAKSMAGLSLRARPCSVRSRERTRAMCGIWPSAPMAVISRP